LFRAAYIRGSSGGFGRVWAGLQKTVAGNKNSGNYTISEATKAGILEGLKAGQGIIKLSADYNVSKNTVQTIREKNRAALPAWRRRSAAGMMEIADKLIDDLKETYKEIKPGQKPIALGILMDKISQANGESSQVVEHKHLHIAHSDVNSLLSDNQTGGEASKQRENEQSGTIQDTKSPAIDVESVNQKESPGEDSKRGGGGRANPAALDT